MVINRAQVSDKNYSYFLSDNSDFFIIFTARESHIYLISCIENIDMVLVNILLDR